MINKLRDEVAERYESAVEPGWIVTRHPDRQRIDLRTITIQQADELVKKGLLDRILIAKKFKKIKTAGPIQEDIVKEDTSAAAGFKMEGDPGFGLDFPKDNIE